MGHPEKIRGQAIILNCKRCGIEITFDDGRCLNANTGMPHSIRKCTTKPGYVYCPEHMEIFPRTSACNHYMMYGWKFNHNEAFIINLILEKYQEGDFLNRKRNRKTSFDKMKETHPCLRCGKQFPKNADRIQMDEHEKECILQTKLI